jgi:CRISPR/Cas system-associated exonuclease Cas4 (RecB family)
MLRHGLAKMGMCSAVAVLAAGLWACGGGQKQTSGPRTDLKPYKEISTIELFEEVFAEKGYSTDRNESIYVIGFGEYQVDLWVKDENLPLVVEYLTEDERRELGGKLESSKVGDKFKLVAVATEELGVIFDNRDYVFQPNPKSEDRYEVTRFEIEKRLRKDIIDVIEELEKVMEEETQEAGEEEEEE